MSYILDALRKSESERHQGQVPHLGANPMLIHAGQRQQPLWPYILTGALLLNATVVGLWIYHGKNKEAQPVVSAEPVVRPAPAETVVPQVVQQEPAVPRPGVAPVDPVPVIQAAPAPAMPVEPSMRRSITLAEGEELIRPAQPQPRVHSAPEPLAEAPVMIAPQTARQTLAYDPYLGYMDDTAPDARHYRQAQPYGETISRLPADTPAVHVPYLDEMPEHFRRRVPTLRFNSHIYASEPSARRIMVNNIYLRQGQAFEGMTVQEITEDGAIFVLDGVLFSVNAAKDWINR